VSRISPFAGSIAVVWTVAISCLEALAHDLKSARE
jgi:hypothetical protein